jgi:hypothetical protein
MGDDCVIEEATGDVGVVKELKQVEGRGKFGMVFGNRAGSQRKAKLVDDCSGGAC